MIRFAAVTYTRPNEYLTDELIFIGNLLNEMAYDFTMEWYCEKELPIPPEVKFKINKNYTSGTKYSKILNLLSTKDYDYLLSIDNDIDANIEGLSDLVKVGIGDDYDLAWGKIYTREANNLTSNLVKVDKLLSHNIIRPLLWKYNLGVTIPGQCFLLKASSFRDKLPETDTFLDDLSIGLYAAKNKLRYLYSSNVVAKELPSYSFSSLFKQRSRWATGFKQSLSCPSLKKQDKKLLFIHGFSYHILPLLQLSLLVYLLINKPLAFFALLICIAALISHKDIRSLGYALIYQLIFPVFHIRWLQKFI